MFFLACINSCVCVCVLCDNCSARTVAPGAQTNGARKGPHCMQCAHPQCCLRRLSLLPPINSRVARETHEATNELRTSERALSTERRRRHDGHDMGAALIMAPTHTHRVRSRALCVFVLRQRVHCDGCLCCGTDGFFGGALLP